MLGNARPARTKGRDHGRAEHAAHGRWVSIPRVLTPRESHLACARLDGVARQRKHRTRHTHAASPPRAARPWNGCKASEARPPTQIGDQRLEPVISVVRKRDVGCAHGDRALKQRRMAPRARVRRNPLRPTHRMHITPHQRDAEILGNGRHMLGIEIRIGPEVMVHMYGVHTATRRPPPSHGGEGREEHDGVDAPGASHHCCGALHPSAAHQQLARHLRSERVTAHPSDSRQAPRAHAGMLWRCPRRSRDRARLAWHATLRRSLPERGAQCVPPCAHRSGTAPRLQRMCHPCAGRASRPPAARA